MWGMKKYKSGGGYKKQDVSKLQCEKAMEYCRKTSQKQEKVHYMW